MSNNPNISNTQKNIIASAVESAREHGITADELATNLSENRQLEQDDRSSSLVNMFQDPSSNNLRDAGTASNIELRQEIISQLTAAYRTEEEPEPFAEVAINPNLSSNQHQVISQTVGWLAEENVNTQSLSQQLNGEAQTTGDDRSRYLVRMYQDPSRGRLRDMGDATDLQLREEMLRQLTEAFRTDENPEPFASVTPQQAASRRNQQPINMNIDNLNNIINHDLLREHNQHLINNNLDLEANRTLNNLNIENQLGRDLNRDIFNNINNFQNYIDTNRNREINELIIDDRNTNNNFAERILNNQRANDNNGRSR